MLPVFPIRLLLIALPVLLVAALLVAALQTGLKNQGVAWFLTAIMVVAAVFIGIGRSRLNNPVPEAVPAPTAAPTASQSQAPAQPVPPASSGSYVWDDASVLSGETVQALDQRNDRLWERYRATIGVVICNYGRDDLYGYAMQCAEEMGLGGYDFIVALDISGDNYWLVQGADLMDSFTDDDCTDYAWSYMESWFAMGDYDSALLDLTEALEVWYGNYYG